MNEKTLFYSFITILFADAGKVELLKAENRRLQSELGHKIRPINSETKLTEQDKNENNNTENGDRKISENETEDSWDDPDITLTEQLMRSGIHNNPPIGKYASKSDDDILERRTNGKKLNNGSSLANTSTSDLRHANGGVNDLTNLRQLRSPADARNGSSSDSSSRLPYPSTAKEHPPKQTTYQRTNSKDYLPVTVTNPWKEPSDDNDDLASSRRHAR